MNIGGISGIERYRELNALNAAKVPGDTKRMAVTLIDSGKATSADEAIIMAKEGSFKNILASKMG